MRTLISFLLLVTFLSCSRVSPDDDANIGLLADHTCKAISIRRERFALADQIRFIQDTLAQAKNKSSVARLQNNLKLFMIRKAALSEASLRLADTIHRELDAMVPYRDKAAQKRFNARLDSLLAKRGCKI